MAVSITILPRLHAQVKHGMNRFYGVMIDNNMIYLCDITKVSPSHK